MHRKIILLLVVGLLTFGCAGIQPKNDLSATMDQAIEELKDYKLEDYGIRTEDFESMVSRIILLGDIVYHKEHGLLRTHYATIGVPDKKTGGIFKLAVSIGKKVRRLGLVTTAVDLETKERATWFDVDECSIPELVDTGTGKRTVTDMDVEVYAKLIGVLLMKEVYYPPKGEEECEENTDCQDG